VRVKRTAVTEVSTDERWRGSREPRTRWVTWPNIGKKRGMRSMKMVENEAGRGRERGGGGTGK